MAREKRMRVLAIRYSSFKEKIRLTKKFEKEYRIEDMEELHFLYLERRQDVHY